jgi:hypothetical protein
VRWGWEAGRWSLVAPTAALRELTSGRRLEAGSTTEPCAVAGPLRLRAPRGADLPLLYRAERYLALTSIDSESRGYALTPASFDRGVREGGDADELRGLLERLFGSPVPGEWLAALGGWSSSEGRLTLSARLLLSGDRPETLDEALGQPATRGSRVERISPRHAAVRAEDVSRLLTDLAQAGLPVEIDRGLRVEPSDAGRSAALANGAVETAWVALEVLRRIAPEVVAEQRDLETARRRLDAVLGARVLEALDRRATSIMASIANRRRSGSRGRVV